MIYELSGAKFSLDRQYRYALWRSWQFGHGTVLFICLNPSTADEIKNDATIIRCINNAKRWGYEKLLFGNIFAIRGTDPKILKSKEKLIEVIGEENDATLLDMASQSELIICAWGNYGKLYERGKQVRELLKNFTLNCFRINGNGEPIHPLYLPNNAEIKKLE